MSRDAPTVGGLFDGAGLLAYGLHRAGWEHSWLCESDPWRRDLLRARFPGAVVYDDVRTVRGPFAADASGERRSGEGRRRTMESDERAAGADDQGRGEAATDTASGPTGSDAEDTARRLAAEPGGSARRVDLLAGGFPCKGATELQRRAAIFDEGMTAADESSAADLKRRAAELAQLEAAFAMPCGPDGPQQFGETDLGEAA